MLGELVRSICRESIMVTADGTLSTSTPVPDIGVVEKTSIVGSTTLPPDAAGAAFWARADDALKTTIPIDMDRKRNPCTSVPPQSLINSRAALRFFPRIAANPTGCIGA